MVLGLLAACLPARWSAAAAVVETNLAPNPGFEVPDSTNPSLPNEWDIFAANGVADMRLNSKEVLEGERSLQIKLLPKPGAVQGVLAHITVDPQSRYTFRIRGKRDRDVMSVGAGGFRLVVEWINAARDEIKRDQTEDIPLSRLSRLHWRKFEIENCRPPRDTVTAKFGVHFLPQDRARPVIYLDGAEITAR